MHWQNWHVTKWEKNNDLNVRKRQLSLRRHYQIVAVKVMGRNARRRKPWGDLRKQTEFADVTCWGRLFQVRAAATGSPTVDMQPCTTAWLLLWFAYERDAWRYILFLIDWLIDWSQGASGPFGLGLELIEMVWPQSKTCILSCSRTDQSARCQRSLTARQQWQRTYCVW